MLHPLSHIRLKYKLALILALPLLALALAVSFAINRLQWTAGEISDMGTEDMPLVALAGEIDGNLMDEALEVRRAWRLAIQMGFMQGGKEDPLARLADAQKTLGELSKVSEEAFAEANASLKKASDDPDPTVVATYRGLLAEIQKIDDLQQVFEDEAAKVFEFAKQSDAEKAEAQMRIVIKAEEAASAQIGGFVKEVQALTAANVKGADAGVASAISVLLGLTVIASIAAIFLSLALARAIMNSVNSAREVADRIATGDLSGEVPVTSNDEIGRLFAGMKAMQAEGVSTASIEIAQGNSDLSSRTEQQASALEETSASMEQMGATAKQNADSARQANQLAMNASTVAVEGGDAVNQVVQTMRDINDSSKKISDIIGVIDGIAFQTNILALNAAVEAARAGEQGRGFAVVASEVRNLAQRSAEAAKEIKSLITASVERVGQGTTQVDKAGATMQEVVQSIRRVTDIVGEISSASLEQSTGVGQVSEAVSQMDQATQQNAALVEQSAAAASSLRSQAAQLVQSVAMFRLVGGA